MIKNNVILKYLMKNVIGFSGLDMGNSAFCSVQDKDI